MKKGFTLIEIIIYTALIALSLVLASLTVGQIIQTSKALNNKAFLADEVNFLLRKIEWTLTDVAVINSPAPGASASIISVDKADFPNNPIIIDLESGNMRLKKGTGSPIILNNQEAVVGDLIFEHLAPSTDKPAGIKTSFKIDGETHQLTIYLRQ